MSKLQKTVIILLLIIAAIVAAVVASPARAGKPELPKNLRNDLIVNGVRRSEQTTSTSTTSETPPRVPGYHFARGSRYQTYVRVIYASSDTRWLATTKAAVANWSKSSRVAMVMASACPTWKPQRNCVYVKVRNDGPNGILGLAVIWANAHIVTPMPVVYLNSYYPGSATDPNLPCHELGHTLGLDHPIDGTMGPCNGVPRTVDYDALRKLYAHTDGAGYPPGV